MDNADFFDLMEDVYQLAKDTKNFVTSDVVKKQKELERATMKDEHMQNMI